MQTDLEEALANAKDGDDMLADLCREAQRTISRLRAELAEARKLRPFEPANYIKSPEDLAAYQQAVREGAFEEAAKVAEQLGGDRIERDPDGTLRTYDMNCKHERGSATLNAMRVRAHTIAQAIRAMIDKG